MAGAGFKTFNTGDVLTASDVNTYLMQQTVMVFDDATARSTALPTPSEGMFSYLKDTNLTYRYDGSAWLSDAGTTSPLTTKGDVWGYSTADARIPVGADGTVLTADSGEALGVKWAAAGGFTGCLLYRNNASLSFTQNVAKIFDGYSETLDTDSFHSTVTNTSRVTIPAGLGGKYKVYGNFNSTTADKTAEVYLYKNGSVLQEYGIYNGEVNSRYEAQGRPALSFIAYIDFVAGDYLEYGIKSNWVTGTYAVYFQLAVERMAS